MRLPQAAADADGRHSVPAAVQRAVVGAVARCFFHSKCRGLRNQAGLAAFPVRSMGGVHHMIKTLACACALVIGAGLTPTTSSDRQEVRMVINLISGVKMPYPENLIKIAGLP